MTERTEVEKAVRIRAEVQLIGQLGRSHRLYLQATCPRCAGRVGLLCIERDAKGHPARSSGKCSTPHCLEWTS